MRLEPFSRAHVPLLAALLGDPDTLRWTRIPEPPPPGFGEDWAGRYEAGRSFRARLALEQTPEGKWRVEFDEPWAREGAKPPEAEGEAETPATDAAASASAEAA